MMLLLVLCAISLSVQANENDTDSEDPEDDIMVEVPLSFVRNANWYFDNYEIQKERADSFEQHHKDALAFAEEVTQELDKSLSQTLLFVRVIFATSVMAVVGWAAFIVSSIGAQL